MKQGISFCRFIPITEKRMGFIINGIIIAVLKNGYCLWSRRIEFLGGLKNYI